MYLKFRKLKALVWLAAETRFNRRGSTRWRRYFNWYSRRKWCIWEVSDWWKSDRSNRWDTFLTDEILSYSAFTRIWSEVFLKVNLNHLYPYLPYFFSNSIYCSYHIYIHILIINIHMLIHIHIHIQIHIYLIIQICVLIHINIYIHTCIIYIHTYINI